MTRRIEIIRDTRKLYNLDDNDNYIMTRSCVDELLTYISAISPYWEIKFKFTDYSMGEEK